MSYYGGRRRVGRPRTHRGGSMRSLSGLGRRRTVRRRGAGFFGDVWNGIKRGAEGLHNAVKDSGIIGKLAPGPYGSVARTLGYGRRRRRPVRRRRVGGSARGVHMMHTPYSASWAPFGNPMSVGTGRRRRRRRVVHPLARLMRAIAPRRRVRRATGRRRMGRGIILI